MVLSWVKPNALMRVSVNRFVVQNSCVRVHVHESDSYAALTEVRQDGPMQGC